ncbi:putative retinol dehydrogenase protein [Neofusicoccum parvum UCRNP2]|uniref:Putative retinol dehydrogenase protein n=1 Tax=Botryosphaeria parva (strain UCR-NP2) TaxID=1287680 RepID=R1GWJ5_BOTPV|nr:putative retinol dehydrogenase protein [Neofusicoccum parvum UCRNP2]
MTRHNAIEFKRRIYLDRSLQLQAPSNIQDLVRMNVLNALASNAVALSIPFLDLGRDEVISPFNLQGPRPAGALGFPFLAPDILRPTPLQITVVHHPWIDVFPIPGQSSRPILGQGVSSCRDQDIPDLNGKVIIVTGGNAGLGLETVRQFAKHNPARIYLAARSKERGEAAIKQIQESNHTAAPISFLSLDLSSFESIKAAARAFQSSESRLDILVNNAGIMMTAEGLTKEGYEIQFGTNVMGHALLTQLLLPTLQATAKTNPEARVVNLSSASEALAPSDIYKLDELKTPMPARHTTARYCISKIANVHYASALAARCGDVKVVSVHPGMVATNLHRESTGFFLTAFLNVAVWTVATPVEKGALSQLWAAVSSDAETGEFYAPVGVPGKGSLRSRDRELREQLWGWVQEELRVHL